MVVWRARPRWWLACGLALGLVGCSPGQAGDPEPSPTAATTTASAPVSSPASSPAATGSPAPEAAPALATLYGDGHDENIGHARIDVIGLERTTPTSVTARFRVTADRRPVRLGQFHSYDLAGQNAYDYIQAFSGFFLLDDARFAVYHPMKRDDVEVRARCLCSYSEVSATLEPGQSATLWAVYHVPPETTSVAVGFHGAGLTPPLPISPAGTGPKVDGEPDAAVIEAAYPNTTQLVTRISGTTVSVAESGTRVEIALNTDVLFEFDKATLTGKAKEELRRAADRIGTEAKGTVKIVGHTDDVGTEAYNLRLSVRRAEAVRKALRSLVRNPGVSFTAEGKGETQPAVKGTSERARARNRRVEVIFEREVPAPSPRPTPSSAPSAEPAATDPGTPLATARGVRRLTGLNAELLELRRISRRGLIATFSLSHASGGEVRLAEGAIDRDAEEIGVITGFHTEFFWVALTGPDGTRYLPLTTPGDDPGSPRHCVCSVTTLKSLGPGRRVRLWVLMTAPPEEVTTVDVNLFGFTPMKGVRIAA